jgi:hypothetical protein
MGGMPASFWAKPAPGRATRQTAVVSKLMKCFMKLPRGCRSWIWDRGGNSLVGITSPAVSDQNHYRYAALYTTFLAVFAFFFLGLQALAVFFFGVFLLQVFFAF